MLHALPSSSSLTWSFYLYLSKCTGYEVPYCAVFSSLLLLYYYLFIYLFILTAIGVSPGGSGTTIRHNTQNYTTIKRNTAHKTTHTIHTLHRMKIQQSQLRTCSAFGLNILLSSVLSCNLGLCCSLYIRDQVSHPYRTTDIVVLSGKQMGAEAA
jgi:hypothetical protein